jgi:hypothetical protein
MAEKKKPTDRRKFVDKLTGDVVQEGEALHRAMCITFASQFDNPKGLLSPGGMCSCCGAGPRVDGLFDWWLVFKAGFTDSDGVFMSMLCGGPDGSGCLPDLRAEHDRRKPSFRDEAAAIINDLLGDDIDGAQAMFEDADYLGMLDGWDD